MVAPPPSAPAIAAKPPTGPVVAKPPVAGVEVRPPAVAPGTVRPAVTGTVPGTEFVRLRPMRVRWLSRRSSLGRKRLRPCRLLRLQVLRRSHTAASAQASDSIEPVTPSAEITPRHRLRRRRRAATRDHAADGPAPGLPGAASAASGPGGAASSAPQPQGAHSARTAHL